MAPTGFWTPAASPPNLPSGYVGVPYSLPFQYGLIANGYADSFTDTFTEPPGLAVNYVGWDGNDLFQLSGTPTTPGIYTFTIALFNTIDGPISSVTYTIEILATPPFVFPNPANLIFFDNANVVPAPQGVTAPFNDEPANVWLGWDAEQCVLCVTNYNRLRIICCFQGQFPV